MIVSNVPFCLVGIVDVEELFYFMDMTPKELYRLKIKQLQREIE